METNWLFGLCRIADSETEELVLPRGGTTGDRIGGKPSVCLVKKGHIRVFSSARSGGEILVNELGEGGIFGVCNIFDGPDIPTRLEATRRTTLLFAPKDLVRSRLRENPAAMEAYAVFCDRKLQFLLSRIATLTPQSARGRLCQHILAAEEDGRVTVANKDMAAEALGIGRSSLFRELAALEKRKIIVPLDRKTYAVDRAALVRYMEETS